MPVRNLGVAQTSNLKRGDFVLSIALAALISVLTFVPLGVTASADGSPGVNAKPAARACTFENPLTPKEARVLVGLKQRKARELARGTYKWGWRVGERDGEGFAVTTDYQPCRVTVAINNGRVTKILQVG